MATRPALSSTEIQAFHKTLSNWGRFGERDQLGTLNLITAEHRAAAARSVRSGRSVSCARSLPTQPAPDNLQPVVHLMTHTGRDDHGGDYFAIAPHGYATSHIDALCHIFHEGKLYNGYSTERVTSRGALDLGIHELAAGVVTRGVLLDVPAARGVDWLEPGDPIYTEDLERAEQQSGVRVESGDLLLVRTGRWRRRKVHGPWRVDEGLAGLDASCLPWLHERGVAALGCDGVSDVMPTRTDFPGLPIHSVAIVAMGLHLIDNLDLEVLAEVCAEESRHDFLITLAPLVLFRGTASPVNPIALF